MNGYERASIRLTRTPRSGAQPQAAKIRPETAEIFKKLDISKPKTILTVD